MTIDPAMLMAFVDGELGEIERRTVERAVAGDPEVARRLAAELALLARLRDQFVPVEHEPLPEAWVAMIATAAREDARQENGAGNVVNMADARTQHALRAAGPRWSIPHWSAGMAIAASLVLGVMIGSRMTTQDGPVVSRNGTLQASAALSRALDTQLASAAGDGEVKMLTSFRRAAGDYCRVFTGTAASGIACRESAGWQVQRLMPGVQAQTGQYRQAGSAQADLMAAAQDMAEGAPLDARQEADAISNRWQKSRNGYP